MLYLLYLGAALDEKYYYYLIVIIILPEPAITCQEDWKCDNFRETNTR